jgi:hypothetical protein
MEKYFIRIKMLDTIPPSISGLKIEGGNLITVFYNNNDLFIVICFPLNFSTFFQGIHLRFSVFLQTHPL